VVNVEGEEKCYDFNEAALRAYEPPGFREFGRRRGAVLARGVRTTRS
jgi:RimJ/RimL family protein N-acetyltransferase